MLNHPLRCSNLYMYLSIYSRVIDSDQELYEKHHCHKLQQYGRALVVEQLCTACKLTTKNQTIEQTTGRYNVLQSRRRGQRRHRKRRHVTSDYEAFRENDFSSKVALQTERLPHHAIRKEVPSSSIMQRLRGEGMILSTSGRTAESASDQSRRQKTDLRQNVVDGIADGSAREGIPYHHAEKDVGYD